MDPKDYSPEMVAYVYGELSKEEAADFEARLAADPELKADLDLLRLVIAAGKKDILSGKTADDEDDDFEQAALLADQGIRDFKRKKRKEYLLSGRFRNGVLLPIAAGLAAFLFVGNILIYMVSPTAAFLYYFQEYTPVYYAQAEINQATLLYDQSTTEYQNGNYHLVAENMRELMERGKLNVRGKFTLGMYDALMDIYKTYWDRDIDLEKIEQEEARWYLAITAYKLNDLDAAQELFGEIAENGDRRARKAARLERKIRKMD